MKLLAFWTRCCLTYRGSRSLAVRLPGLGVLAGLAVLLLLGLVLTVSSPSEIGVASQSGTTRTPLVVNDYSAIPQAVIDDAVRLATSLFSNSREAYREFISQILAIYSEARDKDFVILFNSGGLGEHPLEDAPGWRTIISGIEAELSNLGYRWLALDYLRTDENWGGRLTEMQELMDQYPTKARYLASRIEFLTRNIPEVRVILTAESTGTVISDRAMTLLRNNPRVFSIQTGPPFWHRTYTGDRTLVLSNNGLVPDAFTRGDFLTIIRSNLRELLRLSQPVDDRGNIFYSIKAPGHVYWWQYPIVSGQVTGFLEQNFGIKIPAPS